VKFERLPPHLQELIGGKKDKKAPAKAAAKPKPGDEDQPKLTP